MSARNVFFILAASLALVTGACSSRVGSPGDSGRADTATSSDAAAVDAVSIDAPSAVDAHVPADAFATSDARPSSDASPESSTNRDAGCPCPQGDACMDEGDILCAPHPDYPCPSTDGSYAYCTDAGWDCRFSLPAIC